MPELDFAAILAEDKPSIVPPADVIEPGVLTEDTTDTVAVPGEEAPAPTEAEAAATEAKAKQAAIDRRFASQTAKRREAERRADAAEARLARLEQPAPKAATPDDISPAQFKTYEEYTTAIARRAVETALSDSEAKATQKAQQLLAEGRKGDFQGRLAKEGKAIEGFADVLETVFTTQDIHISPPMAQFLMEDADNAAPLVKWLHDNPDEAERISELRPTAQVKELVRRDALLGKSSKPVSRAPAPPPSLTGSAPAPNNIEKMGHDDLKKMVKGWNKR